MDILANGLADGHRLGTNNTGGMSTRQMADPQHKNCV